MNISWLESILYGLLSGFAEFVPISAQAHGAVMRWMFGVESVALMDLSIHAAMLISLLMALRPQLRHLGREQKLMQLPKRRRKRQPDQKALMDLRLLKTAAVPMLLCYLIYPITIKLGEHFLWLVVFLILNGIMLYLPRLLPSGNKDSRMLTPLDAILLGIVSGASILPGISRLGVCASVAQARGADRQYALDMAFFLSVPALAALVVIDSLYLILAGTAGISFVFILKALLAALAAYIGAYLAIILMRFLAVKAGFYAFANYSWGAALFVFILYLWI